MPTAETVRLHLCTARRFTPSSLPFIMDTFDNFQYENSSAYGGMSVIDDNSSVYTDNTREDTASNIDLSSLSISDMASQSNGITGLVQSSATIDEDFDGVLDDLKDDGIVDLPPHACRYVTMLSH